MKGRSAFNRRFGMDDFDKTLTPDWPINTTRRADDERSEIV